MVFTDYGVVIGVKITSVKRHDLVKIKPTESEEEHQFHFGLRCLRPSENCVVAWRSRKHKWREKPITIFDSEPCDWLVLALLLPATATT